MLIIDSYSFENAVSLEMVQKLKLDTTPHPNPYPLCWLQKESKIKVTKGCLFPLSVGNNIKMKFGMMLPVSMPAVCCSIDYGNMIGECCMMTDYKHTYSFYGG